MVTLAQIILALQALAAAGLIGIALGDPSVTARIWFGLGVVTFPICVGFLGVLAALERARIDRRETGA